MLSYTPLTGNDQSMSCVSVHVLVIHAQVFRLAALNLNLLNMEKLFMTLHIKSHMAAHTLKKKK